MVKKISIIFYIFSVILFAHEVVVTGESVHFENQKNIRIEKNIVEEKDNEKNDETGETNKKSGEKDKDDRSNKKENNNKGKERTDDTKKTSTK
ncbi:MAG: hypothetical protein LBT51_03615 [Fusobacteriaceae bacterium]|jgi:hypothetical protein|nr:hypothetical protein [Fusobacteriaceae bacterium]